MQNLYIWLSGTRQAAFRWLVVFAVALAAVSTTMFAGSSTVWAKGPLLEAPGAQSAEAITKAQLPPQGRTVLALIASGGPFKHDKDGTVFGNRERLLPAKTRGYYREYTVRTPGERTRGARRIVCGGVQPTVPDVCYYTADHYASFQKIAP